MSFKNKVITKITDWYYRKEDAVCLWDNYLAREAEKPDYMRTNYAYICCPCKKCNKGML